MQRRLFSSVQLFFLMILLGSGLSDAIAQQTKEWTGIRKDDARLEEFLTELDLDTALSIDSLQIILTAGYEQFVREDYEAGQAELLLRLGLVYTSKSMLSSSIEAFEEALSLFEELGMERSVAQVHLNLGTNYGRRGDYDQATAYLLDALQLFEELDDRRGIADAHLKLGTVGSYLSQYEEALKHYDKSLEISLEILPSNVVTLYGNIAVMYMEQGDFETSERYFLNAINYEDEALDQRPKTLAMINLGQLYKLQGDQITADKYLDAGSKLAEEGNMLEELVAISLIRIDKSTRAGQLQSLADLALLNERATKLEMKYMQYEILKEMIVVNKSLGRYQDALELTESQNLIEEELINERKERDIATLRASYALDKSKQEIQVLHTMMDAEAKTTRLILIFSMILAVGFLVAMYFYFRARKANHLLRKSQSALSASNQVKDKLFSIIGHDLKNAISSQPMVIDMMKNEAVGPKEYSVLLDGLEGCVHEVLFVLDTLLNWGKLQIKGVLIQPVYFNAHDLVANSVRLVQLNAGLKEVKLINEVPSNTAIFADRDQFQFVVRNLLSNAVKYCSAGDQVTMGVETHEGGLVFFVQDTGVGMDEVQLATVFDHNRESLPGTAAEVGNSIALILSQEFVCMHRGRIWAESDQGRGSVFYFSMSADQSDNE